MARRAFSAPYWNQARSRPKHRHQATLRADAGARGCAVEVVEMGADDPEIRRVGSVPIARRGSTDRFISDVEKRSRAGDAPLLVTIQTCCAVSLVGC
jgi:hypothetical protein